METKKQVPIDELRPRHKNIQDVFKPETILARAAIKTQTATYCDDCRALSAFHAWKDVELQPSFNTSISFADWNIPPAGKHAVIELVTASIEVPSGEWARLRMNTSLGSVPSNLDLVLTPQGQISGQNVYVATHNIRSYTDGHIEFNVNRDNAQTSGHAFICISGYLNS